MTKTILFLAILLGPVSFASAKKNIDPKHFIKKYSSELLQKIKLTEMKSLQKVSLPQGKVIKVMKGDGGLVIFACLKENKDCLIKDLVATTISDQYKTNILVDSCSNRKNHLAIIMKSIPLSGPPIPLYRTWNLNINNLQISAVDFDNLSCEFNNY